MKKLIAALSGFFLMVGFCVAGTVTNQFGHVVTTSADAYGNVTTSVTVPGQPSVRYRTQTKQPGVQIDTNVTTTITDYTPRDYGDILVGGYGTGTNAFWVAVGLTTADWSLGGLKLE